MRAMSAAAPDPRRVGLVLSGGGALGAFEVGVVAALQERGIVPTVLSGTSAGALNAAALGVGFDADRLGGLWTSITSRDVFRLRRDVWRLIRLRGLRQPGGAASRLVSSLGWTWLMETDPLRRTLVRGLGGTRLRVPGGRVVVVSAVEAATGELVRFCSTPPPAHRRSPRYRHVDLTVDHLMASAAIPLLFRPGRADAVAHWDGGIVANTPLAPAMAYEPDVVIVVTTATRPRPSPAPRSMAEAVTLLLDNVLGHSLHADLARAREVNAACRRGGTQDRRVVELVLVEPTGLDLGGSLDFDPAAARERIRLGVEVGGRVLGEWAATRSP